MQRFAEIYGTKNGIEEYKLLASEIKTAFNQKFYNAADACYDNNTITANLLPLYFGISDEKNNEAIFNNILKK